MVDIICSRCNVFITKEPEPPQETVFCARCIIEVLQVKLQLASDLAKAVRLNYNVHWDMPQSVMIALEKFEAVFVKYKENIDGSKRN